MEIPGRGVKLHWLMAVIKVYLMGLKASAWKYLVNSRFVVS